VKKSSHFCGGISPVQVKPDRLSVGGVEGIKSTFTADTAAWRLALVLPELMHGRRRRCVSRFHVSLGALLADDKTFLRQFTSAVIKALLK